MKTRNNITRNFRTQATLESLENRQLMAADLVVDSIADTPDSAVECRRTCENLDYGDAPDSYRTTRAVDGPSHVPTGPMFGELRDAEADGQPSTFAIRDGIDEDGLLAVEQISATEGRIVVRVTGKGVVNAWLDFNQNGEFDHPTEQIVADAPVTTGVYSFKFEIPETPTGHTYVRMRIDSDGGLKPTGPARNGEVEDYCVSLNNRNISFDLIAELLANGENAEDKEKDNDDSNNPLQSFDVEVRDEVLRQLDWTNDWDVDLEELDKPAFEVDSFFDIHTELSLG